MGDKLSQGEIDALFAQFTSGSVDEAAVEPNDSEASEAIDYDFTNPTKFNKEQLRTLGNIFENYSRNLSSFLTGYLRAPSHLEVLSYEETTYKEFSGSLLNPTTLCMLEFLPLKGTALMEVSSGVSYAVIDRILGGPGFGLKKIRDFSEIEKILMERFITQMLSYLAEPWENIITMKPKLDRIETNSQFAQVMPPNEKVALIVLNIKLGSAEGYIKFCIPHYMLKPVMEMLNTQYWFEQQEVENRDSYKVRMEEEMIKAVIPISAVIGRTQISVNDFINLQVGDYIHLDSYMNSEIQIMVGNMYKFKAKPGVSRGKNAFQITSLIEKEELYNG